MKFVALMIAFILGYLAQNDGNAVINKIHSGFEQYSRWFDRRFTSAELSSGWGGLVMFALVPAFLLGILIHFISGGLTLLLLILQVLVLGICLVPVKPEVDVNAVPLAGTEQPEHSEPGETDSDENPRSQRAKSAQWMGANFHMGEIAAIIFWYFVLGALGALTVKLLFVGRERKPFKQQLLRLLFILNWLPGRLLILSYALVGNFRGVLSSVGNDIFKWDSDIEALEQTAAKSALWPHFDELKADAAAGEIEALYRHAIICWLTIIALISITV